MSDADEFERLILALQGTVAPSIPTHEGSSGRFDRWLHVLAERGGSDLLLVAGVPPSIRIDGRIQRLEDGPLDGLDIEEAVLSSLPPHAQQQYRDKSAARPSRFGVCAADTLHRRR